MKRKSILIDACYVNNGGAEVLLKALLFHFSNLECDITLIADKRLKIDFEYNNLTILSISGNPLAREFAIFRNYRESQTLLCFNNIGPFFKYPIETIIYFHNVNYLRDVRSVGFFIRNLFFKRSLRMFENWVVQTPSVKFSILKFALSIPAVIKVDIFPFYPEYVVPRRRDKNFESIIRFVYLSDGHPYKNHELLLNVFERLYGDGYRFNLTLTISHNYPKLLDTICRLKASGLPIGNICPIKNEDILFFLSEFDVSIYTSSRESFGLGLIESALAGLIVVAPRLPYVTDVIVPSLTFDLDNEDSLYLLIKSCLFETLCPASISIENCFSDFSSFLGVEYV